jgi:hypothetical protein
MSMPSRTPPNAAGPTVDPLRELIEFVSGEERGAPPKERRGPPVDRTGHQIQDDFTSEVITALTEVVAVLDGPEMATFFARSYAQGNTYAGPQVNLERLRALIAKASARGYQPRRAA